MATIYNSDQFMNTDPSSVFIVPLIIATIENLKGYAKPVSDYEKEEVIIEPWPLKGWRKLVSGTGIEGGIAEDLFEFEIKGDFFCATNHAVKRSYITAQFDKHETPGILIREANYHPDGGQVFFSPDRKPYIALLALPTDDIKPEDFKAFYCDGSFGIQILPNVWHQPIFPLHLPASFKNKQGKVHACVAVDFVIEFGTWLKIPYPPELPAIQ